MKTRAGWPAIPPAWMRRMRFGWREADVAAFGARPVYSLARGPGAPAVPGLGTPCPELVNAA